MLSSNVTFRPDLSPNEKLRKFYETLGEVYRGSDVIIVRPWHQFIGYYCRIYSKKFSDTVWLDNHSNKFNRLPSTELLDLAISEGLKLDVDCQLVNCVHADTASMAIEKLKKKLWDIRQLFNLQKQARGVCERFR